MLRLVDYNGKTIFVSPLAIEMIEEFKSPIDCCNSYSIIRMNDGTGVKIRGNADDLASVVSERLGLDYPHDDIDNKGDWV